MDRSCKISKAKFTADYQGLVSKIFHILCVRVNIENAVDHHLQNSFENEQHRFLRFLLFKKQSQHNKLANFHVWSYLVELLLIFLNKFKLGAACAEILIHHENEALVCIRYVLTLFLGVYVGLKPDLQRKEAASKGNHIEYSRIFVVVSSCYEGS